MIVGWLLLLFIIVPLGLFLHELGHGFFAFIRNVSSIHIGIGRGKEIFSFQMGRIHVHISLFFFIGAFASYSSEEAFTYMDKIMISLGGPLFSMAAFWLSWWGFLTIQTNFLFTLMLFNGWLAFINLIPYKVKDKKSDGYTIIEAVIARFFNKPA
ncbi:site-2 protease family protein [Pontibacillus marinus]|uniref:Peptidase M50 domain-containing protein n=1 Tax=Pontibacillus marinus BH030004 = DSM 16465 TaxID=1385511 RepID=A0A0A5FW63_9BACI|nr:site-2 protease family protein [Pontibacillus marinus]KGX83268.1 hypothetical protein N783_02195 [Pontibacillus marinus BH030004 = DSM 16465]